MIFLAKNLTFLRTYNDCLYDFYYKSYTLYFLSIGIWINDAEEMSFWHFGMFMVALMNNCGLSHW